MAAYKFIRVENLVSSLLDGDKDPDFPTEELRLRHALPHALEIGWQPTQLVGGGEGSSGPSYLVVLVRP